MNAYSEKIWRRGSAVEIMREGRERFRESVALSPIAAHVALASVHYSLIKRYMNSWWQKPLAFWHLWRAAWNINTAFRFADGGINAFGIDQIDVATRVLAKTPSWLGGDRVCASSLLNSALFLNSPAGDRMKPHTRALMLITLGDIEWEAGGQEQAWAHYTAARRLLSAIEEEDVPDRERQLIRVLAAIGLFYYDHSPLSERYWARKLVTRAIDLAHQVSKDQERKIIAEWHKRGF